MKSYIIKGLIFGLIIGLLFGFGGGYAYNNYSAAGGGGSGGGNSVSGIWTGTEYANPWLWTDKQWVIFSNCVSDPLSKLPNKGTQRWPKCAVKATANSPFAGKKLAYLQVSNQPGSETLLFTVSSTGNFSGQASNGDNVSGYINPNGGTYLTVGESGRLYLRGKIINITPNTSTAVFGGSLINEDKPSTTYLFTMHRR